MRLLTIVVAALCAFLLASCSMQKLRVDLILLHGHFETLDKRLPDAGAVAVNGGRIVGVGTNSEIESHFQGALVIDLKGSYVYPGLIDGHAHMVALGVSLSTIDLMKAESPEDISILIRDAAARTKPGRWIRGSGWNPSIWPGVDFQAAKILDKVAGNDFVFLISSDGQAAWVNSKVLKLAGITRSTPNPNGGRIIKDRKGNPTGILAGSAIDLVTSKIPPPSETEIEDAIVLASDTCARYGITEVQDAGIDGATLKAYERLDRTGRLRIRIYAMYNGNDSTLPAILKKGPVKTADGYFTMRSIRVDMDGTLRSREAALVHAYSDDPGNYGMTLMGGKDLENLTVAALASGFQVCTEAHGDRAISVVLRAYTHALHIADIPDARLRIEGVGVILPRDVDEFAKLGILPSMQPAACISDMYWIESLLGPERTKFWDMWKSLLDSGAIIIGGSDFPYQSPDPRLGIYAAVTRRDPNGLPRSFEEAKAYFSLSSDAAADSSDFHDGFFPSQAMSIHDALNAFVKWPAYAAFQENVKGSISIRKYADFTFFSNDIRRVPPRKILSDRILGTFVGGKLVYASPLWSQVSIVDSRN